MLIRSARRIVVFVIGATVVLFGVVLLVTPGPAFIVIPAGLAILATEFAWAAWLLKRMKKQAVSFMNSVKGRPNAPSPEQRAATETNPS
jgi:tellurite resistance protein TerC